MIKTWLAVTTAVTMITSVAIAQTSPSGNPNGPPRPSVGEPIMTLHSAADTTGPSRPVVTPADPGAGSEGVHMDNGNAAGAIVPGQPPKLMSTPE
jgi:hypothetical protein